jgi:O-acetyl-ADP-ribose deacetylase (regulator of RNase III)
MKVSNDNPTPRISVTRGQLAQQTADAIVNAAPRAGDLPNGARAYIWNWDRRQRKELEALIKQGRVPVGGAAATSGGKLPARWVIHTVFPAVLASDDDATLLSSCYQQSLAVAAGLGASSVGFSVMLWPDAEYTELRAKAAQIAVTAAMRSPREISHVLFATPNPAAVSVYEMACKNLL